MTLLIICSLVLYTNDQSNILAQHFVLQDQSRHNRYLVFRAVRILSDRFSLVGLGLPAAFRSGFMSRWWRRQARVDSAELETVSPGHRNTSKLRRLSVESDGSVGTAGLSVMSIRSPQEGVSPGMQRSMDVENGSNVESPQEFVCDRPESSAFDSLNTVQKEQIANTDITETSQLVMGSATEVMSVCTVFSEDPGRLEAFEGRAFEDRERNLLIETSKRVEEAQANHVAPYAWTRVSENTVYDIFKRCTLQV